MRVIATVIALAVPLLIYGWDFSHRIMHTGIYRDEFAGEVMSARPTVKAGLDWLMSGSSSRHRYTSTSSYRYHWYDSQNVGRYVLKIRGADNHTFEVSVSKHEYDATMIPSYVVCHEGRVQHFHDRLEAVKRGAVPRQPGDPL